MTSVKLKIESVAQRLFVSSRNDCAARSAFGTNTEIWFMWILLKQEFKEQWEQP